jgi:fructose-specific phosphotransferase system IIA component
LAGAAIELHKLIAPEAIVDLQATTKKDALRELTDLLSRNRNIQDSEAFLKAIYQREDLASTGVGLGVAIPHVKISQVSDYVIAVGRKSAGIEFDSLDGQPVRLIVLIGASDRQTRDFVKMLARVMRLLKDGANRVKLLEAELPGEFIEIIRQDDLKQTSTPA